MSFFSNIVSNKSLDRNKSSTCDVCHRAEKTREYFPTSLNKAKEIFYLIHCDVWGPYSLSTYSRTHYFLSIIDDCSRVV